MAFPRDLHAGVDVYSSDGHKLGTLHRIVLKRSDLSLLSVVVEIGFLRSGHKLWEGGIGLDYDRVVPAQAVASATDERVGLNLTAAQFKDLPEYTEEHYESPHDLTPGDFDIPDLVNEAVRVASALGSTPNTWLVERLNKPLDSIDVVNDMDVWRVEPHQKIGDVERALFNEAGRLQAFVVRRGFLLTRDVILPARYIVDVIDSISIRVEISDGELDQLREYAA